MKPPKTALLVSSGILVFLSAASIGSQGFDWPRWRGPQGNGISRETGWNPLALADGARVLWEADIGRGYSNVAIKNNRVYTLGLKENRNAVCCLDAETGKQIWKYSFESTEDPQATPTVDGESVYVLSKDGILVCSNLKSRAFCITMFREWELTRYDSVE
jgi:outer membrane protein assembly factor BamB